MIAITHSMFVGHREDLVWFRDSVWTLTAHEAISVIDQGGTALIPEESGWEEIVRTTLLGLGADDEHVDWCFRWQRRVNEEFRESIGPES